MQSNSLSLNGKEYKAKFVNLTMLKRIMVIEAKMAEIDKKLSENPDMVDYDEKYNALWLKRAGYILEGDVSDLSMSKLHPQEVAQMESFFLKLFTEKPGESQPTSDATT